MIVSGHQPNFLPYLGFFKKMKEADIFLIGDCCQFVKREFHHRNRIRISHLCSDFCNSAVNTTKGWKWITVPIIKQSAPINKIRINNNVTIAGNTWNEYIIKLIYDNYRKSPFFSVYSKSLFEIIATEYEALWKLNLSLIIYIARCYGIKTKIVLESEIDVKGKQSQRILEYTKKLGGKYYLAGEGTKNFLDVNLLLSNGVKVVYLDFKHPIYKQRYRGFISHMSAIDALFNVGRNI